MSWLQTAKLWLIDGTHLAKDALHIYVGLLLFCAAAALFRWPIRGWKPWLVVLAAALAGEAWDMIDRLRFGITQDYWGNWKDVWNTLFWPTALMLIARYSRLLKR